MGAGRSISGNSGQREDLPDMRRSAGRGGVIERAGRSTGGNSDQREDLPPVRRSAGVLARVAWYLY